MVEASLLDSERCLPDTHAWPEINTRSLGRQDRAAVRRLALDGRENLCCPGHSRVTMAHSCSRQKRFSRKRFGYANNQGVSGNSRALAWRSAQGNEECLRALL